MRWRAPITVAMLAAASCLVFAGTAVAEPADAGVVEVDATEASSPATVEASLTQVVRTAGPIAVGEAVTVSYEIRHPAGATITFPEAFAPERWVLIDAVRADDSQAEGATTSTWTTRFGLYRPGTTTLEAFPVRVTTTTGDTVEILTEPVEVKVISIFADATEEPDFKAPQAPVPVWVDDYTLAYVGGGALALCLFGLGLLWAERRRALIPAPPPPPRTPHEVALEKLGALAGDDLVERGEYMFFWIRLSEAIREYLGRTYGFPPTELTTTEMLGALDHVHWPSGLGIEDVSKFLRRCDEVKFGGATPDLDESNETLRRGFTIVELTRPRMVEQPLSPSDETNSEASAEQDDEPLDDSKRWAPPAHEEEE